MKQYKVWYGKPRGVFSKWLSIKAEEIIEADSLVEAMKIARDTASTLGYEVNRIKETSTEEASKRTVKE